MESFDQVFEAVMEYCKNSVPEAAYKLSFKDLRAESFDASKAVLSTATEFIRNIVENRYSVLLIEAFESVLGYRIDIDIVSRDRADVGVALAAKGMTEKVKKQKREYTFDNFIKGENNEIALAAAMNVAKNPGTVINPLYIYGASGLGKTHLLKAIENYIEQNEPNLKVVYVGCEQFTNDFVTSIRYGSSEDFREKYRMADVLLIDDIQFISGKEATQEEFFHTFNTLHEEMKQIVVASDRPAKDIDSLEERIRTRLEGGMSQIIRAPDFETRTIIVLNKASEVGVKISREIAEYISINLESNVRQLEGAVNKLYARSLMDGSEPTMQIAEEAIHDLVENVSSVSTNVKRIISEVARVFEVEEKDIVGRGQKAAVSSARQISMYIIREVTDMTMEKIGEYFGRNYTTVVYAVEKVSKLLEKDHSTKELVSDIMRNCR